MKYLVTGGAGFIGSNIVRSLVEQGKDVRVLDDLSTGREANLKGLSKRVKLLHGDIRDDSVVRNAVAGVKYVLHLAAIPSVFRSVDQPLLTNSVNIGGTLNMLVAARDAGVERFVLASSSSVYGNTVELPKREDMLPRPLSPYALQKLACEHYCAVFHQLYGLRTYMLRFFNVFGPRQDPASEYAAAVPRFISALSGGKPPTVFGDGNQTRDFSYVDDVARAVLSCCQAADAAAGGVFNIAGGNRTTVNDLIACIGKIVGSSVQPVYASARKGDVRDSHADISRAQELLGWKPEVRLEEGLRRTVEWFKSE